MATDSLYRVYQEPCNKYQRECCINAYWCPNKNGAEVARVYYHAAGFFPIKEAITLVYVQYAIFMDTGSVVFNSALKYIGGPKEATG